MGQAQNLGFFLFFLCPSFHHGQLHVWVKLGGYFLRLDLGVFFFFLLVFSFCFFLFLGLGLGFGLFIFPSFYGVMWGSSFSYRVHVYI
jgi:hypothetical protein